MTNVDLRGLERDLRKLPGVVACAVAGETVCVLLAEDANRKGIGAEAADIAARYGAGAVRILESPDAVVPRPAVSPVRARVAIGTAAAAAVALIASLVPVARRVAPKQPPAAIRPAPAAESGSSLPPVLIPGIGKVAPAKPRSTASASVIATGSVGVPVAEALLPRTPARPAGHVKAGRTKVEAEDESSECGPPGHAYGRRNHEGDGNESAHRHHGHGHSHHEHWFDCT